MVAPDLWLLLAKRRWVEAWDHGVRTIVVPDVRFANEASAIRRAGGEVWMVYRPECQPVAAHCSEDGIPLMYVDRLIVNSGSVQDMRMRVLLTLLNSKSGAVAA